MTLNQSQEAFSEFPLPLAQLLASSLSSPDGPYASLKLPPRQTHQLLSTGILMRPKEKSLQSHEVTGESSQITTKEAYQEDTAPGKKGFGRRG